MEIEQDKFNEEYIRASARMEELKAFYSHVAAYFLVNPFLIFVNYMTYWDYKWFWYPMAGWGVAVIIHGLITFGFGSEWEKRKIEQIIKEEKNKQL